MTVVSFVHTISVLADSKFASLLLDELGHSTALNTTLMAHDLTSLFEGFKVKMLHVKYKLEQSSLLR